MDRLLQFSHLLTVPPKYLLPAQCAQLKAEPAIRQQYEALWAEELREVHARAVRLALCS